MTPEGTHQTVVSESPVRREIMAIPVWAVVIAAIVLVAIPVCIYAFSDLWSQADAPPFLRIIVTFFPGTILAFLTLMVGYVNKDAGRRGMSRTLWTLVVIFVPNAIGFILYFLLRNPIRTSCPKCGAVVDPRANYCPSCRHSFHPTCPQCKAAVQPADKFCANCGSQLA
jgi:hypothetical protein